MKKFTLLWKNFGSRIDDKREFDTFQQAKKVAETIINNKDAYDVRIVWSNDRDSEATYWV